MKRIMIALIAALLAAGTLHAQNNVTAKIKWATEPVFEVPESALYDSTHDIIYVANIKGQPGQIDSNGYISKLKPNGTVEKLKWVTGLSAPKGMGIYQGKLYVTDITRLVEIDIQSAKITNSIELGAAFANDIAIDSNGTVYVSDHIDSKIYRVKSGKGEVWMDKDLGGPNGLLIDGPTLLAACNGDNKLRRIDPASRKTTELVKLEGGLDGLMPVPEGGYLISGWSGVVFYLGPDGARTKLLDTRGDDIQSADIGYDPGRRLLLIPTFFDNRVVAYELSGLPKP